MSRRVLCFLVLLLAVVASVGVHGCARKRQTPEAEPLDVTYAPPVVEQVTDYLDFTGRMDSINSVELRPRVTGYIMKTPFKEGDLVKENDVLFLIDKRPYKAKLDDALGRIDLLKAKLNLAKADNRRAKAVAKTPGAISKQELDKYAAAEEEAIAAVKAAEAGLEIYKLDLGWCEVQSPISGRVGRILLTTGNLVNKDTSIITTLVSEDPIYAYFDVDERSWLTIMRGIKSGKVKPDPKGNIPVTLALGDERGFPHKGNINFANNKIDPLTGTITVRGVFSNPLIEPPNNEDKVDPKSRSPRRLFTPGMFVRIHLQIGTPHRAVMVAEKVVVTDQGLKNVFILDKDDKVQYRRVDLGATQEDGLRVVESGLDGKERVLINALQLVRPGMKVVPEKGAMPRLALDGSVKKAPSPKKK